MKKHKLTPGRAATHVVLQPHTPLLQADVRDHGRVWKVDNGHLTWMPCLAGLGIVIQSLDGKVKRNVGVTDIL